MNQYIKWGMVAGLLCMLCAVLIVWWFGRDTYNNELERYEQELSDIVIPTQKEVLNQLLPENTIDTYTERQEQIKVLDAIAIEGPIASELEVSVERGTPTIPPVLNEDAQREQERRINALDALTQ